MSGNLSLVVREATPADAAEIARLNAIFNAVPPDAEAVARRMAHCTGTERVLLAEIDGRAVGFACLWLFPVVCYARPYAEIAELFVEEEHRRAGIGRALLEFAAEMARLGGAHDLYVATAFRNTPAQRLYQETGFQNFDLRLRLALVNDEERD
jgi:GNAT superfamily N-acetyltransferase